ncbi:MAG: hypothetical protein LBT52_05700, partial [Clostridiales Family XIII bacterium]|nr:hypothetical protein [Clostridiales Family XIII bacterium]
MKNGMMKKIIAIAVTIALVLACTGAAFAEEAGAVGETSQEIEVDAAQEITGSNAEQAPTDSGAEQERIGSDAAQARTDSDAAQARTIDGVKQERAVRDVVRKGKISAQAYTPDTDAAKYIKELISARLLTSAVYNEPFFESLNKTDLAAYAMTLYSYLGGVDPGSPEDNYTDTSDPNAEKGYMLGFFDNPAGYFFPENYVNKGEALTVLAKVIIKAKPAEASRVPSAWDALSALEKVYDDASSISSDHVQYIGFMNARGALLLPRGAQVGSAWLGANSDISRTNFFVLLSDILWAFEKGKISPYAVSPPDPKISEYQ